MRSNIIPTTRDCDGLCLWKRRLYVDDLYKNRKGKKCHRSTTYATKISGTYINAKLKMEIRLTNNVTITKKICLKEDALTRAPNEQ